MNNLLRPLMASGFALLAVLLLSPPKSAAAPANASCTVVPANAPVSPAEAAYRSGDSAKALDLFREQMKLHPDDARQWEGVVRTLLRRRDDAAALEVVNAHKDSKDEWALLAASEYFLYRGQMERAQQAISLSIAANLCNAQAHLQAARLYQLSSMYAKAKKQIDTAHMLDKSDPRITNDWLGLQPSAARTAYFKALSGDSSAPEENRKAATENVNEAADEAAGKHVCRMTSAATSTAVNMVPHMSDGANISAWALNVDINGHVSKLLIDTGASGLLINRAAAEKAGLKPFSRSQYFGVGDKGTMNGFSAYAQHIRIGAFDFEDCVVDISEGRSVAETEGLIGTDIFSNFMVTLDFPARKVSLAPLPGAQAAGSKTLDTGGDSGDTPVTVSDRYDGPEVKDFMPVFRSGHDLLLPMTLNGKSELMILDTGADGTMFNQKVATDFTKISQDHSLTLEGVSGKTNNVWTTGDVKMRFGAIGQDQNGAIAYPMTGFTGGVQTAGLLGSSFLYNLIVDLDYRDGLVRFTYDRNHGANAWRN